MSDTHTAPSGHDTDHGKTHDASVHAPAAAAHEPAPHTEVGSKEEPLHLSTLAQAVVNAFEKKVVPHSERHISVNPVVSKFAAWYEKLRNAMEYREDEVILRATVERILRRRLLLGGNAKTTAAPLIRELIWARYLPHDGVGESMITNIEEVIDLYLQLRLQVLSQHTFSDKVMNEWIYDLMSSHIATVLKPNPENQVIVSFMFQIFRKNVEIVDDTEETKDAQVYLAVRKAFARDDRAFLRFYMFGQIFGLLTRSTVEAIAKNFPSGFAEINKQLDYPKKDVIYGYVKKHTAPFLILEDVFLNHKENLSSFVQGDTFKNAVYAVCEKRYKSISAKITRAIIRSVIFLLLTKLVFAFLVEGTYEILRYGEYQWNTLLINTGIPPLLMIAVGLMIRPPDKTNTDNIYAYIRLVLSEEHPKFSHALLIKKAEAENSRMNTMFGVLWSLAFLLSFGSIVYVLYLLYFNIVSMFIFVFFLAIVSFLAYRISLTASIYRIGDKQGLLTPVIDFLFLPIIRVGSQLTEGISQINILIFLFDFVIETPFKELFAFFEQLFYFLHTKRDELG
ncbi:MAG: hypothetical protein KBD46_03880 [Candidatus Levybacteria bacterium]|nr:hypothetical protein [Candidatus Levybacteria bacterium]